jgi:predicted transcriptional regulator
MLTITAAQARAHVFDRQHLTTAAPDLHAMVQQQIVVQTQLDQGLEHAAFVRVPAASIAQVNAALHARTLVKTWTIRSTKHTAIPRDLPLLVQAVNRERIEWWRKAICKRFKFTEAQLDAVEAGILDAAKDGPLDRKAMHAAVPLLNDIDPRTWNGAMMGLVYRGEMVFTDEPGPTFARRDRWLPDLEWSLPDEDIARREFIRRFFYAFGPATLYDLAHWAGWRITDTRNRLAAVEDMLRPLTVEGWAGDFLALASDIDRLTAADPAAIPPVLLIGKFDALSVGWKDKTRFLDEEHYKLVYKKAAQIEATVWFSGRVAGGWRSRATKKTLTVTVVPFRTFSTAETTHLEAQAAALAAFYGLGLNLQVAADF